MTGLLNIIIRRNAMLILATTLVLTVGAAGFASSGDRRAEAAKSEPTTAISEATPIVVEIDGVTIKTTFGSFLAENTGFDSVEVDDMWERLQHGERYHRSGGEPVSVTLSRDM